MNFRRLHAQISEPKHYLILMLLKSTVIQCSRDGSIIICLTLIREIHSSVNTSSKTNTLDLGKVVTLMSAARIAMAAIVFSIPEQSSIRRFLLRSW